MITNKDLGFSVDEYKIVNPKVKVNIQVKHIAVDLEIILHIIGQNDKTSFKQKILLQIDVNAKSKKYLTRVNQSDLFLRVPVSENIGSSWTTKMICGKKIQFKLPENYNFNQLYMVKNMALPKSDSDRDSSNCRIEGDRVDRGTLYIQIESGKLLKDESNSGNDRVDQIHKVELQKVNWSSMFSLID
jgi:DnaJ-class molecular chaperone